MRMSIEEFKKKYPNIAKELFSEDKPEGSSIDLRFETPLTDPWRGYLPGPIDYIRRAKSIEEALKVIDYLEEHGEITLDEAQMYREKLLKEGLEAFGPRKEDNYYYRKAMEYWRKMSLRSSSDVWRRQRS